MLPQIDQIGIARHPFEIVEAQIQRLLQRGDGAIEIAGQRIAARQVVEDRRVTGAKLGKLLVDPEAGDKFTTTSVVIPENLQGLHKSRVTADHAFHETNFDVQVPLFLTAQFLAVTVL